MHSYIKNTKQNVGSGKVLQGYTFKKNVASVSDHFVKTGK
jgi:hypothetical protein